MTSSKLTTFTAGVLLAALAAVPVLAQGAPEDAWSAISSPHFTLYTNAAAARGVEIAERLERFRAVFAQLAPQLELKSPAPTKILAFRDAESYAPYKTTADRGSSRVLGQFLSHSDGNYLTLDAGTRLVGSFAVIYHEYVHYFVRHNFPGVPLWFNEGLAEYYSTFEITGDRAVVGAPVARHLGWLERHADLGTGEVLATEMGSRKHQGGQAGRFYAVSWAMVHYLLSGDPERLDSTADYFLRLREGESPEDAFEEAFGLRVRELEEKLVAYIASGDLPRAEISLARWPAPAVEVRPLPPPDAHFHLGDLLAHMGRDAAAERHFQIALDHQGDHPETHAGLALVREHQNRFEEAALLYQDAVDLGSADPLTHLLYGRHLLNQLARSAVAERPRLAARARERLRRVVDLDPGFGEGWALYGRAHLVGEGSAERGIEAVARARELLPERLDLIVLQAQLHLQQDRPDRAEALVEGVLAPQAQGEMVDRARELIECYRLIRAAEEAFGNGEIDTGLAYYDEAVSITSDPQLRESMEAQLLALQERAESL